MLPCSMGGALLAALLGLHTACALRANADVDGELPLKKHHGHHHHRHHHHKHHKEAATEAATAAVEADCTGRPFDGCDNQTCAWVSDACILGAQALPATAAVKALPATAAVKARVTDKDILAKMRSLEGEVAAAERGNATENKTANATAANQTANATGNKTETEEGTIKVNGPLEKDFDEAFASAVSQATGCKPQEVKVLSKKGEMKGIWNLVFEAPKGVASSVEEQAADPDSLLATGVFRPFLLEQDEEPKPEPEEPPAASSEFPAHTPPAPQAMELEHEPASPGIGEKAASAAFDVDTEMPYGDLEPFGREDTAQELTEASIKESNAMVDQLERAEVAEEKRAVFRALTRLRGAAITSFDGVARSQTGNIDEYNKVNKWRPSHPIHHLANEESDVSKWAFPDSADF